MKQWQIIRADRRKLKIDQFSNRLQFLISKRIKGKQRGGTTRAKWITPSKRFDIQVHCVSSHEWVIMRNKILSH